MGIPIEKLLGLSVLAAIVGALGSLLGTFIKEYFLARSFESWKEKKDLERTFRQYRKPLVPSQQYIQIFIWQKFNRLTLRKPTVFILGAGASSSHGFPLGENLKSAMISNMSSPNFKKAIEANNIDMSLSNEFTTALKYTSHPTIDIFLEKMKIFRTVGSYLIAYTLLPLEREDISFPARNWYKHLYDVIDFEHAEPDSRNIRFVSLNYDRSL